MFRLSWQFSASLPTHVYVTGLSIATFAQIETVASTELKMTDLQTYRGNCHCGGFVYQVKLPEITSVLECDCSICTKKGYLWVFPGEEAEFTVVKDDGILTEYTFGEKSIIHKVQQSVDGVFSLCSHDVVLLQVRFSRH